MVSIDQGVVELYVVAVEEPARSKLAALREGDRCYAEENHPVLHSGTTTAEVGRTLWMMGTGAGLAPFLCMLRHDESHLQR